MYCQATDLAEFVLQAYLDKVEELNPGLLDKNIVAVSGEIDDVLRSRYQLPLASAPATLKRICVALSCYRSLGAITSLMDTDAGSDNQFLFIQDMARQARKDLELIQTGKMDLGLTQLGAEEVSPGEIQVSAPTKHFDLDSY